MPGNRKRVVSKRMARKKISKRRPVRSGTTKRNPFTGLVVTGVRSVVAALPGSAFLTPIVDLLLSSIGLSSEEFKNDGQSITKIDGVSIYGLCGMCIPRYSNILCRTPNAALNTTKGARVWCDSPFADARLIEVVITAVPDNKIASRSGKWTMVFIPFRDANDYKTVTTQYIPLAQSRLQTMAGSISDVADRPLQIKFRPKPSDGYIYHFNPIDFSFGAILIGYSEDTRLEYHEFTAEDFATNITIRGTIELREPHFKDAVMGYEDIMWSPPSKAFVYSSASKTGRVYSENFTCAKSTKTGQCIMRGTEYKPAPPSQQVKFSLEAMSLD